MAFQVSIFQTDTFQVDEIIPIYVVEIELTTGNWTDISAYCKHANISRQLATAETGLSVGIAQITVMNNDGRFSPNNSNGAYYPNMKINKAVRIKATYNSVNYWLFTGVTDHFIVNPTVGDKTCTITLSDKIKILQYRNITLPLKININVKILFEDVLDAIGITSTYRTIDAIYDTISFAWFQNDRAIEVLNELLLYGNYQMYVGPDGTLNIKDRYWGIAGTSIATYAEFENIGYEIGDDIANYIIVSGSPRIQATAVTVIASITDITIINAGATVTFTLPYYDTVTKETGVPAIDVVTPIATTDYTAEGSTGVDRTANLVVNVTIYGASVDCQVTNNHTLAVSLTKFQLRGKPIQKQFDVSATSDDATSIAAYGQRTYAINTDYISTLQYAQDYGDYIKTKKKINVHDTSIGIKNIWPDVTIREIGNIITLTESNTGINGKYVICGIEHDIMMAEGFEHINNYELTQWIDNEFLMLDDVVMGKLDNRRLAF